MNVPNYTQLADYLVAASAFLHDKPVYSQSNVPVYAPDIARIGVLFRSLREARCSARRAGLADYLTLARPYLRHELALRQKARPVYVPSPVNMTPLFVSLNEALSDALGRGDFLEVWKVVGLKRNELRNASVLAWLLNPRGSHGHGDRILREVLLRAACALDGAWTVPDDLLLVQVRTEERPLGIERDRVDIAVDGPDFVLFIEVKVDAPEGTDQLARYLESAREKARAMHKTDAILIYLAPRRPKAAPPGVACVTWRDIADISAAASAKLPKGLAVTIVRQFAHHIRSFA